LFFTLNWPIFAKSAKNPENPENLENPENNLESTDQAHTGFYRMRQDGCKLI